MQPAVKPHRFSVSDWQRMGELGLLAPDQRVELIEGEIIDMAPIGSAHAGLVTRLTDMLASRLSGRALLSVQNPLRLGDFSEPQPDLMLLRPREDFYSRSHPSAKDVLLLVEVADATLGYDRDRKVPLYGCFGVSQTWLINVPERMVEVYINPDPHGYADRHIARAGEALEALFGVTVEIERLFGDQPPRKAP
jgi:Uma2 family endonuclease